jgi:DNA-binding response OmpR family regulator
MMLHTTILIIEDEPFVEEVLIKTLKTEGFTCFSAKDGHQALEQARKLLPDLIVLDLGLPKISGHDVFRILRQDPATCHIPLLILTGMDKQDQEATLLLNGADDYMTKPFDIRVLIARIRHLLQRSSPMNRPLREPLKLGPVTLDQHNRTIFSGDLEAISLSPKEFDLLYLLAQDASNVVDRTTIAQKVWGKPLDEINSRAIDVYIRKIRIKLTGQLPLTIEAISGRGYRLTFR